MIHLNPASIPPRTLPSPLSATPTRPPSRNFFIRNTYETLSQLLLLKNLNPFRCNTYKKSVRNSFRSNTYKKQGGTPPSHSSSFILALTSIRPRNHADRFQQNPEVHAHVPILDVVQIQNWNERMDLGI